MMRTIRTSVLGQMRTQATAVHAPAHAAATAANAQTHSKWTREQVQSVFEMPLLELVFRAATVHRANHDPTRVQFCTLMNIKEGGCSEDCAYCSQSSRYDTHSKAGKLEDLDNVLREAQRAKENGSTRFCMGAAWREIGGRKRGFNRILDMVREIR